MICQQSCLGLQIRSEQTQAFVCFVGIASNSRRNICACMSIALLNNKNLIKIGAVPSKGMQTPPPLRSGHLDLKDMLKKSYRAFELWASKRINIKSSSKVTKFAGKIGIGLTLIFCMK